MQRAIAIIIVSLLSFQFIYVQGQEKDIVQTAIDDGNFKTLVTALTAAGLVDTLKGPGPFTVFAPNDAAFAKLPAGVVDELVKAENKDSLSRILQYHVTTGNVTVEAINAMTLPANVTMLAGGVTTVSKDGTTLKINGAVITMTNVFATNGVIHIIDSVILPPLDIVETAITNGNFKTLVIALKAADLVSALKAAGPFTVFAPNDAAFAKLPSGTIEDLLKPENKQKLANILKYHVIAKRVAAADIKAMTLPAQEETLSTLKTILDLSGDMVKVNAATVTTADVSNTNGLIHIVDSVILPPGDVVQTAVDNGSFKTLVAALTAASLVDALKGAGPFTVFAPTDAAFAKLPAGVVDELLKAENKESLQKILQYHVTGTLNTASSINRMALPANITMLAGGVTTVSKDGSTLKINGASVTIADIFNTNGMIHVIDSVILPPLDIFETAITNGNFKTLITALKAADLVSALKAAGPLTVFAPNDAAFAKLPNGTIDDLLKPENKQKLANILKYHVIAKRVAAADIKAMTLPAQEETLSTLKTILDLSGDMVKVNAATVTTADVSNTNGLIHIVDSVILPPGDVVQTAVDNGIFKTLVAALTAASLVDALKGAGPFTVFAPTDAAFAKLPAGVVDELLKAENKESLQKILQYHVTSTLNTASSINRMALPANITMLAGGTATVSKDGSTLKINGASVTIADIFNTNGMIHVIDSVILPPLDIVETAITNGNFKTLVAALKAADLVSALKAAGPFTVFAPNDAAFAKLPAGVVDELVKAENKESLSRILQYHVLNRRVTAADISAMTLPTNITMLAGGTTILSKDVNTIKINNAAVITADVSNTNGMIHVIDAVILPPLDIVELAITNGNFKTLVTALKAADLVSVLKGPGPFTVFAPNDAAFAKLPNGTIDDLLKPENKGKLANTLKYHVVNGKRILSADLMAPQTLDMFAGGKVEVTKSDDKIKVNDATIIAADVGTNNGVIHVIDTVLTPRTNSAISLHSSQMFLITLASTIFFSYRFFF